MVSTCHEGRFVTGRIRAADERNKIEKVLFRAAKRAIKIV